MIRINKIEPQTVDQYNPDDEFMGAVNEYEFNDIRLQIKKKGVAGYYIKFNREKIHIDKRGNLESSPNGLFDTNLNLLMELIS